MSSKQGRDRKADQDQARIDEVEAGIASAELPEGMALEDENVEITEAEVDNATRLKNVWLRVKQHESVWKNAREKAENEAKALKDERTSLESERAAIKEHFDRLASREQELAQAELELEKQRSDARVGFASELRALTAEASKRRDEILGEASRIQDEARVHASEILLSAKEEFEAERKLLNEERSKVQSESSALRLREAQIEQEFEFATSKAALVEQRFERQLDEQRADVNRQLKDATDLLGLERELRGKRDEEARGLRAELARHGQDPEAAKRRNDELTQQVQDLKDELSRRPPAAEVSELRDKAKQLAQATADAAHWRQQHDQINRQLRYQLTSVGEVEVLRDERDALAAQRETLRQAIEQQRTDWEELQAKEGSKEPFPACSGYDDDPTLTQAVDTRDFDSLADLVHEIRHRMATDSTTPYFYSKSDVRLFLAGLALSRLHLLQGISGTGKTSLPREFFRALNSGESGSAQIIEVQAGWRDKDDLFGFYNAFEKRFVESEFTKALYRALLPANVDRPMVIVLDEMNLAHPEQYFGTMLSVLENAVGQNAYIDLLASEIPGLPEWFEGSRLPLARNVWFVGTANHDETTVAFADKTYDRAHVQELPARHEVFDARRQGLADPISFEALETAFSAASQDRRLEVERVHTFMNAGIREEFARFGVGWGNRLERQIQRFVPVVLQAGGDVTEAVDHLIATKLVRKLEDRFGVRSDDLDELAGNIEMMWDLDGSSGNPCKTTRRIRDEAKRLRGGKGS